MNEIFAAIEAALDKLYAFIAKIFGLVDDFGNAGSGSDEETEA